MSQQAARSGMSRAATAVFLAALGAAHLYLFAYFPIINNPNENVRLYMTRSIVDEGMMALGRRERTLGGFRDWGPGQDAWGYVNDKALVCDRSWESPPDCEGTLYSAKAPGTSYLGVPVYAAVKALSGGEVDKTTAIYWLRLVVVVVPTVVFLAVMWQFLGLYAPRPGPRALVVAALALGSMSFTYGQMFAGHQLASLCLFSSFMALCRASEQPMGQRARAFAAAGFFCVAAVLMEYPTAMPAVGLVAWGLLLRPRLRELAAAAAGAAPPLALLLAFHAIAFGAIHRTPYSTLENPAFVSDIAPGVLGIRGPTAEAFAGSFFAPYNGLFFFAPWTALVLAAAIGWGGWQRRSEPSSPAPGTPWPARRPMAAALAVVGLWTLFISSHSLWRGGWTLGPRYIVGITPFIAFAVAVWADRLSARRPWLTLALLTAATGSSVAITLTCSLVSQGFPFSFYNPFAEVALPFVRDGFVAQNAGNLVGLTGAASVVPLVVLAIGAVLLGPAVARELRPAARLSATAVGLAGAVALAVALTLPRTPWTPKRAEEYLWLRSVWRPAAQSPLAARREALAERAAAGEELAASELFELGWLHAAEGSAELALDAYTRGRKAP